MNALRHEQVQKLAEKFTLIPEHFLEVGGELLLCQEERGFLEVVRPILYDKLNFCPRLALVLDSLESSEAIHSPNLVQEG